MIQTIKKEKLIAQTYMNEVAPRNGVINLYKDDYLTMAKQHRPLAVVKLDEQGTAAQLMRQALEALRKVTLSKLKGLIVVIFHKPEQDLLMKEFGEFNTCLNARVPYIDVIWGTLVNKEIEHRRSIYLFAFGERSRLDTIKDATRKGA